MGGGLYIFQQSSLGQQVFTGRLNVLEGGIGDRASGDAHDIPAREDVIPTKPHGLTHEPTHPVAFDGIADAFAGGKAEAAIGKTVGQDNQDNQTVLDTASLASYLLKAAFIPKAILPAHGIVRKLDGQAFATAQAAPFEDIASTGGFHAGPKAVGLGAFAHFGLPGSFWHNDTSFYL